MEQYISKSALVAEINKRIVDAPVNNIGHQRVWAYNDVKDIIDTLEVKEMQEEPVSEDLFEASAEYAATGEILANGKEMIDFQKQKTFIAGAEWQKNHLWKPADGDDLPEIDREVIVLTQPYPLENSEYAVSFAHRPNPGGWDGIVTGKTEHYTPKTYGKGGWNIPDIVYWLDVKLPKDIEL